MSFKKYFKSQRAYPALHLCLLILIASLRFSNAQQVTGTCKTTQQVVKVLGKFHYSPPDFNESTQKQIIRLFVELLDPKSIFLTRSDVQAMESQVKTGNEDVFCDVIQTCLPIYIMRVKATDSMAVQLMDKPLNFNTPDTLTYIPGKHAPIPEDMAGMNKALSRRLKFSVLTILREFEKDSTLHLKESEAETLARKTALKRFEQRNIRKVSDKAVVERYIAEKLWNAIAQRCDPHSNYFNVDNKTIFEKSLASQEFSFGLVIAENSGDEIEIVKVIPGSPAWKSNDFNEGDVLTGIATIAGKQVDILGMSEDEIRDVIESSTNRQLEFIIRKKNNSEKKVQLEQDKIESDVNVINGYLLKDSLNSVGLIQLPAFYTNFEMDGNPGCSNDVAREILKLKKENIKGLILDLRNNGGGSFGEAMNLAGIFIDEGPLGIIKYPDSKPMVLRDFTRGMVYNGPMLVLINGLSASASEFLSEVLQDYHRAVLVGTPTYGKGTGQTILPVDSMEKTFASGFLKVTNLKFYSFTKSTNQAKGVIPDIMLPDLYMNLVNYKEQAEPYHLPADTVIKNVSYIVTANLPIEKLKRRSSARTSPHAQFKAIEDLSDSLAMFYNRGFKVQLNRKSYDQYLKMIDSFDKRIDQLKSYRAKSFDVVNNQFLDKMIVVDASRKKRNEEEIKDIQSDVALEEAYLILKDLIQETH